MDFKKHTKPEKGDLINDTDFGFISTTKSFFIYFPNTDIDGAAHIANFILNEIRKLNKNHKNSPTSSIVTLSMGVGTIVPDENNSVIELIKNADEYLYKAKENGRNRI